MEFLTDNFKHLTTTPENVEQLKKLVLQMAVQGRLTAKWREENPDVEPASVLLGKIENEKEELIKTGKFKKQRELLSISKEEIPYKIPNNWKWQRLGNICFKITDGFHNTPPKVDKGFPYILATHVKSNRIDWDNCYYVGEKFHRELYNKSLPQRGEILLVNIGAGCGTPAIIDVDYEFSFKNVAILKFPQTKILNKYLKYYFDLTRKETYEKITRGGAQPFLSLKIINNLLIPIPSFQEQLEIIEKIKYFFFKIDHLHALAQKRLNYREKSAKALFSKINNAGNDAELQETWQTLTSHFHNLTQSKESVKQLRQSILQMAVQGKLTAKWREENSDVEPAGVLLEKIKAEKEQLIKDGEIKRQKPLPPVVNEEKPFGLPENWEWIRMGDITDMIYGSSLTKAQCIPNGKYPVYGSNGIVGYYNEYLTEKRSIIVGRKGSSGALNISDEPSWTTDVAYYIEEIHNINFKFLFYLLKSQNLEKLGKGIKPGLNRSEYYELIATLPPLEEQKAIVSKVKQLMSWCDELENKIEKRDAYQEKMMQAVVKQAFKTESEAVVTE